MAPWCLSSGGQLHPPWQWTCSECSWSCPWLQGDSGRSWIRLSLFKSSAKSKPCTSRIVTTWFEGFSVIRRLADAKISRIWASIVSWVRGELCAWLLMCAQHNRGLLERSEWATLLELIDEVNLRDRSKSLWMSLFFWPTYHSFHN